VIGRYRLADYEPLMLENEIWDTNWKCLVENFMDAHNVFKVHRKTFDPVNESVRPRISAAGSPPRGQRTAAAGQRSGLARSRSTHAAAELGE
jgi:phenylpropionate dioxygenase-like ring-hydroxylating dioxygenase large terminal subunit